jgi:hypothetical protein
MALVCTGATILGGCQRGESPATGPSETVATEPAPAEAAKEAVPGPVKGTRLTETYARMVARDTYFWAWPMVNMYNRRLAFKQAPEPGLMNGVLPLAPLNMLSMLHDYIAPEQRWVACPNQDTVYGAGILALDETPVVVQVPDFGERFWVVQVVDLRTDSFADLGAMYGTEPGFYLLVGPDWNGEVPKGITRVFRANAGTALIAPRLFQDDTPQDKQAVQAVIASIDIYPLSEYDGQMKRHDWSRLPKLGSQTTGAESSETKWVFPDKFFDQLPEVLKQAPPLPGEEARYAQVRALIDAAQKDPALERALIDEATKAEKDLVEPLLQFRNWGIQLPYHWTTQNNGAAFGTDYFTRTAVARSNILVNKPTETKYFYQDLGESGARLNGDNRYTVTFATGQVPPVRGFWSLTLYDAQHFFVPNEIGRYSIGTKNKDLRTSADGSLTIYVQANAPADAAQRANWLPAPKGANFSLFLRAYWPEEAITSGQWTPPAVVKTK